MKELLPQEKTCLILRKMSFTYTKLIATVGPAVDNEEMLSQVIDAGVNIMRLNFSHGTHESHKKSITIIKKLREEKKRPVAIMLDTKGPEVRIGAILGDALDVVPGEFVLLVSEHTESIGEIAVTPGDILQSFTPGVEVCFDDGYIKGLVVENTVDPGGRFCCRVRILNAGQIRSGKGINVPGVDLPLPALTEKDIQDIMFGAKEGVDFIAASFIRSEEHIWQIQALLDREGASHIQVVAKIETNAGVENFSTIVLAADGIMIARGDLGVEVPAAEVPVLQKRMIRESLAVGKPVVIATQMLESMIKNPRPTRAEVSDVANAIYDKASATMLSGESAAGAHPIQAISMMKDITIEAEKDCALLEMPQTLGESALGSVPNAIAHAAVETAQNCHASVIFVFTQGGATARAVSAFRPNVPIIALTTNYLTYYQLALIWGVLPLEPVGKMDYSAALEIGMQAALSRGIIVPGDLAVVTWGTPFFVSGMTNSLLIEGVGKILARGKGGGFGRASGEVVAFSPDAPSPDRYAEKIVLFSEYKREYATSLQKAAGAILGNLAEDSLSVPWLLQYSKQHNLPVVVHTGYAMQRIRLEERLSINAVNGIVYK